MQFPDFLNTLPALSDSDYVSSMPNSQSNDGLATNTAVSQADLEVLSTRSFIGHLPQPEQFISLPDCQCRAYLATMLPKVHKAMQEKQSGAVFRGTQQVVDGSQSLVDCTHCKMACTDLICIMAMFQQTAIFFEYIATSNANGAINMSFGGSEIPIHDPKLRAVLVLSLIHQAISVLDALSSKGRQMLDALCTPSPMALANVGHIDKAAEESRSVLRRIADVVDRAAKEAKSA
jgi:hypothetical protein